MKDFLVRENTK